MPQLEGALSPVVRRLISENALDPADIPGTGMGGRITRDDVRSILDSRSRRLPRARHPPGAPVPASPPAPARSSLLRPRLCAAAPTWPPAQISVPPPPAGVRDEIIPFTAIRRVTAEHMVRSKATSAHTLVAIEADFEGVERVRRQHKDRFRSEEGVSLTYLPFISRAVVDVLRDYPNLNSSVGDDALVIHRDINLGFAVDLNLEGLIVPVIHHADGQSLRGIARSVADLAARARASSPPTTSPVGRSRSPTRVGTARP